MDPKEGYLRRELEGVAASTSVNMNSWMRSGWSIVPGHGSGIIDSPPPRSEKGLTPALHPLLADLPEDYFEFIDDLVIAEEAEGEYDIHGLQGTTPYSSYRNERLG